MKVKLPGDIEGGLFIFTVVIVITTIELYFMKTIAYKGKKADKFGPPLKAPTEEEKERCEKGGVLNQSCVICNRDGGNWLDPPFTAQRERGCCAGGLSHRNYPKCVPHSSNREYII